MKRSVLNKLLLGSLVLNMSISPVLTGCGSKNTESTSENTEVIETVETVETSESQNETDNKKFSYDAFKEETNSESTEAADTKEDAFSTKEESADASEIRSNRKESIKNNSLYFLIYFAQKAFIFKHPCNG